MSNKQDRFKRLPPYLVPLVLWDEDISRKLAVCANKNSSFGHYRKYLKWIEISCHGIPWFAGCLVGLWLPVSTYFKHVLINIFFALLLDITIIAVIKALVRRRRPRQNVEDDIFSKNLYADQYSFPSGHVSRAVMLMQLVIASNVSGVFMTLAFIWSCLVFNSRIMLGRHYILDVTSGAVVGFIEGSLMTLLWLSPETTAALLGWLTSDTDATLDY